MPSELRFVFDTNVVISALLLKNSIARQALDKATQKGKLQSCKLNSVIIYQSTISNL